VRRVTTIALLLAAAVLGRPTTAAAQFDITGSSNALFHEDQPERIPGWATTWACRSTTMRGRSPTPGTPPG
jgi:hypothetical protein